MNPALADSYAYCERLTRRHAGNFYPAFRILPADQRRAMCALYAFLRIADDLGDSPDPTEIRRDRLVAWRAGFQEALRGNYSHRLHPALHHMMQTYAVPTEYVEAVIDGVEMDLGRVHFATFAELYTYCYRVASAVGLACIHIWGFRGDEAPRLAESAGIAFQLTNILRDLPEDAARGRVYLPAEDFDRFDYSPDRLAKHERDAAFRALMRFEVERARAYYLAAEPLAGYLPPAGRAVFLALSRIYRGLLEAIERRDYDVFSRRVTLSRWRKAVVALGVLPVRWGWA